MITAQTRLYGLIGHPVRHSLSPAMYNELFRRFGLDACYVAFDVDPQRANEVGQAIRTLDLVGVNLTVPFKEKILPQLDHITLAAREAGAVNVVIGVDGWLTGYNTDGEGLVCALGEHGVQDLQDRQVVVLGAGGTARAVSAALLDRGIQRLVLPQPNGRASRGCRRSAEASDPECGSRNGSAHSRGIFENRLKEPALSSTVHPAPRQTPLRTLTHEYWEQSHCGLMPTTG